MNLAILGVTGALVTGFFLLDAASEDSPEPPSYFAPAHRLTGIGLDRSDVSDLVVQERTKLMIESQTFVILREPRALDGARRITSSKLQKIFRGASQRSGIPASLISAIAY